MGTPNRQVRIGLLAKKLKEHFHWNWEQTHAWINKTREKEGVDLHSYIGDPSHPYYKGAQDLIKYAEQNKIDEDVAWVDKIFERNEREGLIAKGKFEVVLSTTVCGIDSLESK